ncbi:MAG TPA: hypothetical protein VLJ41_02785 [Segetibacter sp.]|nr:hypothetical protein [Segetibacter sp.]
MSSQQNSILERMNREKSKFETIRQLAKRHMMDQYHTTTDEELKNAVVELDGLNSQAIEPETMATENIA